MANPHFITLGDNQWDTFLGPSPSYANVGIEFYGTNPAQPGGVELGTLATHNANQGSTWTFDQIAGIGTPGTGDAYGSVNLFPSSGTVDLLQGVALRYAQVSLNTSDGGGYVLNGTSTVNLNSVLTAYGGRYHADTFTLKGTLNVRNNSTANFDNATLKGPGTVNAEAGGTVDMKTVLAGLHVNVGNGGALSLLSPYSGQMTSAGMINEAAGGRVFIGGLPMSQPGPLATAVKEVIPSSVRDARST
jgi:hypothetical protein